MNEIRFGDAAPCRAFRPMIDFYSLDRLKAAWTLVALCEGEHDRLLLTGLAGLPIVKNGDQLRCTSVEAPNPVVLDGERGSLQVCSSDLRLSGHERGLVSVVGTVNAEWRAQAPSVRLVSRPFSITLTLEARFRI